MRKWWEHIVPAIFCGSIYFILSLLFQAHGITSGDSGDLVTAAATGGVPHPPGYPLFTFLGFLLNKVSFSTPSWNVALLSSFFHAATLVFLFLLVQLITKRRVAAIFSILVLGSSYLYFYYSITPEVFALLDFFIVTLLYFFNLWNKTHRILYLYVFTLIFSLSLSHHHFVLFIVPSFVLTFLLQRNQGSRVRKVSVKQGFILAFLFFLGLTPYLYLPFAGHGNSMINWNKPDTIEGFVRLIRRADYGTFQSGGVYGELPIQRLLSVKAYWQFLLLDFRWIGIIFALLGLFYLWRHEKKTAILLLTALLCVGPVFIFYASFPLGNEFSLGTYERFLLPSHLLLSVFIGIGMMVTLRIGMMISSATLRVTLLRNISVVCIAGMLCLYPLRSITATLRDTAGLSSDFTADRLGKDVLSSVKQQAILLLSSDTVLFNTQYVRYALNVRNDTKVLQASRMFTNDYPEVIARVFPELSIPKERGENFLQLFIEKNQKTFPIYANQKYPLPQGLFWVPRGLVFELTEEKNLPTPDRLATESAVLFASYQDPRTGVLGKYQHFMLSDILDVYAHTWEVTGKIFLQGGKPEEAKKYFLQALSFSIDSYAAVIYKDLGMTYLLLNECQSALDSFELSRKSDNDQNTVELIGYELATYQECFKDEKKIEEYRKLYNDAKMKQEQSLEQWR